MSAFIFGLKECEATKGVSNSPNSIFFLKFQPLSLWLVVHLILTVLSLLGAVITSRMRIKLLLLMDLFHHRFTKSKPQKIHSHNSSFKQLLLRQPHPECQVTVRASVEAKHFILQS